MPNPKTLFLIPLLQVVYVYFYWILLGKNDYYEYNVTYYPLYIFFTSYISFILGCQLYSKKPLEIIRYKLNFNKYALNILLVLWFAVFLSTIYVLKGLPIWLLLSGSLEINEVNSRQLDGFPGQFGIYLSLTILINLVLACLIIFFDKNNKKYIIYCIGCCLLGYLTGGKRQGFMFFLCITVGAILLKLNNEKKIRWKIILIIIVALLSCFFIFELIGLIRGAGESTLNLYLQYPVINFEFQWQRYGFAGANNLFPMISGFIPRRMLFPEDIFPESPEFYNIMYGFKYPEPGIGAGFYGSIHLAFGITGCLIYSFFFGYTIQKIYNNMYINKYYLVTYLMCVWPLISAITYNLFLLLNFFIVPVLLSMLYLKLFTKTIILES